jgi:multiple sugar transport system substrate-binding protein
MIGEKKPKEALDDAARRFERITKRIGKDKVKKSWLALVKNLAAPLKKASGADKWPA